MLRIGVDLGGSKIEVAALAEDGRCVLRRRIGSAPHSYPALLTAVVDLIGATEAELGERATVGVGAPGSLSRATGRVKNANTVCLNDRPLLEDLQQRLGRPVRLANDANCFALSEARDGAAAGARVAFGVILGTGVGGGVVVDGAVLEGLNGVAGEWGHNPLPAPEAGDDPLPRCYCGRRGCLETYLSGPGWVQRFAVESPGPGGRATDAREIVQRARSGDAAAAQALDRYSDRLARGLASVINVLDPDVIVLGGGLSNIDELYPQVAQRWTRYVFSDRVETRLVRNRHGDSSGVRGAAFLWPAR